MEQKNEQSVYEVMTKYAGEVIAEMAGEIFTTRNFIEAFVDKHEIIYVELLFAAYKNDTVACISSGSFPNRSVFVRESGETRHKEDTTVDDS